ncbi:hypothetical protein PHPALM_28264 [Phytophthora palmivora]|uniref:Uncharacterized protein n=1 Tax=Phytophthora palmivora TaxID=4796 RepID=A0A2P4XAI6_9STRA|nr:hypothetical protein PHPALM_28264 [Phytophthora palmivora]
MTESRISVGDLLDLIGGDSPSETWDVELNTTLNGAIEDAKARKKAKHRALMVEFRLNKKQQQKKLVAEHQRLECKMKVLVDNVRKSAFCSVDGAMDTLQVLAVEREELYNQNMALREEINRYKRFETVVLEARQDLKEREESNLLLHKAGWCVTFDGPGKTSFFFYPFTRDEVDAAMKKFEADLRGKASTQVLQELDQDLFVFAHDIPGLDKNLRYLFQVRRSQWKLLDGKRKLTASLVIIDSDSNRRSRDTDASQGKVEWATEGGIQVSVTEVDENSIDVICDHWASCESKLHAEYLMIQWTQFAVWWEQLTVPSNLLFNDP